MFQHMLQQVVTLDVRISEEVGMLLRVVVSGLSISILLQHLVDQPYLCWLLTAPDVSMSHER